VLMERSVWAVWAVWRASQIPDTGPNKVRPRNGG
jgi:hypothetical protein